MAGLLGAAYVLTEPLSVGNTQTVVRSLSQTPQAHGSMPHSEPTRLEIPAIKLDTSLGRIDKNADGTLQVPTSYNEAAWYARSPTPGETGPAIITGHVDSYLGPGVFFYLKDLEPNERILVHRADNTTANFRVDKVVLFSQANFPTEAVYGDIDYAGLRIITCSGAYDFISGSYSHNVVVYASLT